MNHLEMVLAQKKQCLLPDFRNTLVELRKLLLSNMAKTIMKGLSEFSPLFGHS